MYVKNRKILINVYNELKRSVLKIKEIKLIFKHIKSLITNEQ